MKKKVFTNCFLVKTDKKGKPVQVCLAMKKRGFGAGMWNGAGGKSNPGESITEAAVRETNEELGIVITEYEKRGEIDFWLREEDLLVTMHVFLVLGWKGQLIETEEMRPEWFDVTQIPYAQMWKSDKEWLQLILSGKKIKAKYTYAREGGKVEKREVTPVPGFTSQLL